MHTSGELPIGFVWLSRTPMPTLARVIECPNSAKETKSGGMSFETKHTDDHIRALCARVLVAENPNEINDIMRQLRAELRDHVENVRRMVEAHRRHAVEENGDDPLGKSA
jgi:hypothetical protein